MDKKQNTVYAPGELDRVRGKLGNIDLQEAKRMARLLGGEVGYEREKENAPASRGRQKGERTESAAQGRDDSGRRRSGRFIEPPSPDEKEGAGTSKKRSSQNANDPLDDPAIKLRASYSERLKMDRYAAQSEFGIKNTMQVLASMFSFFKEPQDYVSPRFIMRRMNEHYSTLEKLVTATRSLFPRNNADRNEHIKKTSPFVYTVLDTIRYWNVENIGSEMARVQAHPRSALVSECADFLRLIYRPLFILEQLDLETHIKPAYKLLYKVLYVESPMDSKDKNQTLIRNAIAAFAEVRGEVQFGLYPLLMKLISDHWLPYERLFIDRRRRYMAFLNVTENEQISALDLTPQQIENGDLDALREDIEREQSQEADIEEEDSEDPAVIARKAQNAAMETERKALDNSLGVMEALFPNAGWKQLAEFPDLYPYFSGIYDMRKGHELVAPTDPLHQVAVLMYILGDLCMALRYVNFGTATGPDDNSTSIEQYLREIINSWSGYIEEGFSKAYLPRLGEYCRLLENSAEIRTSPYAKRSLNDLHWIKRLYFLPYYKFESIGPPPLQKQEVIAIYSELRTFRKYLAAVAAGIEQGNRQGGAESKSRCDGIDNPWAHYKFEIPNPVSRRMDALLAPAKRNNAAVVFFALSTATVLDNIINSETSWAYGDRPGPLFRSVNGEGIIPVFGTDDKLDADKIFANSLKQKEAERKKSAE
ncbi:MAG: hypothetical protein LBH97_02800 [Treponema sp.]|jgi:hypothetical protein|nr:hypothetical protein [Treponema sp.]